MPRKPPKPYNGAWVRVRLEILERDGYRCYVRGCPERATTVDHIVPVNEAPHLRLVPENLRASCAQHNYGRPPRRLAMLARMNRAAGQVREW